jgi:exodeoxyribonuclease VII large subunit
MTDTDARDLAHIHSVSELTGRIKTLLEQNFPFIWVTGEISNFRTPASGHCYFTLKDAAAQIQAVLFRGHRQHLKFDPEDGMAVTGLGRISVFEPRGTYQVVLEYLEPKGAGALQVAFEQLKKKLSAEGLFADRHKKPIPFLPQKIALITSPSGAVVHDILQIIRRRFPGMSLDILPVKVQGDGASADIVAAFGLLKRLQAVDVVILARGGGSLEDVQAFNDEAVARAIFAADIPVISAVGHETDYTIADFVADLRAPTPSAAAELIVPVKTELYRKIYDLKNNLLLNVRHQIANFRSRTDRLQDRLVDPKKRIADHRLKLDDLDTRMTRAAVSLIHGLRERLAWKKDTLFYNNPISYVAKYEKRLDKISARLYQSLRATFSIEQARLRESKAKLDALSPQAILDRGYSIARTLPEKTIVRDAAVVSVGQALEIVLAKGSLTCDVKGKK